MTTKPKFSEGEKVLCFHGPLIYEAKCLKSSVTKDKSVRYYIHYAGWNKNWDEWVPESRVLKYNEGNLQRRKEVEKAHAVQPSKNRRSLKQARRSEAPSSVDDELSRCSSATSASAANSEASSTATLRSTSKAAKNGHKEKPLDCLEQPKKKKARPDPTVETEDYYLSKMECKIKLPEELKVWLVDDWDVITRQQKLVTLPAKHTVEQIFENYLVLKKCNKHFAKDTILMDIICGLKGYFNETLGSQLLYKFERPQYSQFLQDYPGTPCSKMYGAVHLLRFLSKLGEMLSYSCVDDKTLVCIQHHVQEFLKYVVSNRSTLFNLLDYSNATPEYHRKLQ